MPILRWYWGLKLRWRIPLGAAVLLVVGGGLALLTAWLHYRQCRHLDLLTLVPDRLPLVVRCRDGGAHWDRIRTGPLYRVLEAQIRRRGPLVQWIESVAGRPWEELTGPLTTGPAADALTDARLRGLLGTDAIVAAEPPTAPPGAGAGAIPRTVLLTRIGFLEYLAYPVVRRIAASRAPAPLVGERYRRVPLYRMPLPVPSGGAAAPPGGAERVLAFAVKGDILAVATDADLLLDVLDRTFKDWVPSGGLAPWSLPEGVPIALGADLHRLPPAAPGATGPHELLRLFPVREALLPLDPGAMGRCTFALDADASGVRLAGAVGLRPDATPLDPLPPVPGLAAPAAAVSEEAVAFVDHRVAFRDVLETFVGVTLDPARKAVAGDALGEPFAFFQRQARDIELPALLDKGLKTHLIPRLRGGLALVLTRETGRGAGTENLPAQTGIVLVGTTGVGDAAEEALHEVLQRRCEPLLARIPNDVTETSLPAGSESIRFLRRRSWPVQVAYGESHGVLALGVRPDAVVRAHETLQGGARDVSQSPRYQAVRRALGGAAADGEGRLLTRLYVDLRRLGALLREVAPDLARFAKDRIDGPRLRATLERRQPRRSGESPAAFQLRITQRFEEEVKRVVDEARLRIEAPAMLLDPFVAGGLDVTADGAGYAVRGVLLLQ